MGTFKIDEREDLFDATLRLKSPVPCGFSPKYILHCLYDITPKTSPSGRVEIKFNKTVTAYVRANLNIRDFITELTDGGIVTFVPKVPQPPENNRPNPTPFDLGVDRQCFVVIQLSGNANWIFSQTTHAITRKNDKHPDEDFDLFHIDPVSYGHDPDPIENQACRIIYFSLFGRSDKEERLFNFHVRLVHSNLTSTELIIDPDIRNTGDPVIPP